jgi:hypothetical protein
MFVFFREFVVRAISWIRLFFFDDVAFLNQNRIHEKYTNNEHTKVHEKLWRSARHRNKLAPTLHQLVDAERCL